MEKTNGDPQLPISLPPVSVALPATPRFLTGVVSSPGTFVFSHHEKLPEAALIRDICFSISSLKNVSIELCLFTHDEPMLDLSDVDAGLPVCDFLSDRYHNPLDFSLSSPGTCPFLNLQIPVHFYNQFLHLLLTSLTDEPVSVIAFLNLQVLPNQRCRPSPEFIP